MNKIYLQNYVIRTGTGSGTDKLAAFDRALISAGVSNYNIIKVSSILPPNCKQQSKILLLKGSILPSAFEAIYSNKIGNIISASVGIGIPSNNDNIGVIMKYSSFSKKNESEKFVRELVVQAMQDREIPFSEILSVAVECSVVTDKFYCAFATVSMW